MRLHVAKSNFVFLFLVGLFASSATHPPRSVVHNIDEGLWTQAGIW